MAQSTKTKYFANATATCANCGSVYTLGNNKEAISLEICGNCHPFYTGNETVIDTSGRIDRFKARMEVKPVEKKEKVRKAAKQSLNLYSGEVEEVKVEVKEVKEVKTPKVEKKVEVEPTVETPTPQEIIETDDSSTSTVE
jgi:large subunit ribosomal protein L31